MFGWEFPPKIYGGLAVASYGITKGLSLQGDMETTFCLPKPCGDEEKFLNIIGMNQVPIVWRDVNYDYLKSRLSTSTPEQYYAFRDHIYSDFSYMHVNDLGCMEFAGGYPGNLHDEINNFSIIAGVVARQQEFDIIHAHDWLTYPAGVHAKLVSGKPLCPIPNPQSPIPNPQSPIPIVFFLINFLLKKIYIKYLKLYYKINYYLNE